MNENDKPERGENALKPGVKESFELSEAKKYKDPWGRPKKYRNPFAPTPPKDVFKRKHKQEAEEFARESDSSEMRDHMKQRGYGPNIRKGMMKAYSAHRKMLIKKYG